MRPNYFIFIGYLKIEDGEGRVQADPLNPLDPPLYSEGPLYWHQPLAILPHSYARIHFLAHQIGVSAVCTHVNTLQQTTKNYIITQ